MSHDPNNPHHQPNQPDANEPPVNALGGGLGDILGQILGGGGQQSRAEEPEEDPRYQQRQHGHRVPQPQEEEQGAGGLGGILGQILGGGGQPPQSEETEEDPRYQDPRYRQRPQQQHGRRLPQEEESQPDQAGGGLGGILGGILGGGNQGSAQEDPRQSGVISQGGGRSGGGGGLLGMLLGNPRVLMFLLMAGGAVLMYLMQPKDNNPVTDESVRVVGAVEDDIQMGMQAAPGMIAEGKGEHRDQKLQRYVDEVGAKLVKANMKGDWEQTFAQYRWDFHLLADEQTVNAFALPGGQIFFTYGLFKKLKTEDEVAGVLGHEIGHVIARHSAKQMAKQKLINGVVMAGATATSDGQSNSAQTAQMVAGILSMKYGRDDESQADKLGTQFMVYAGYNPEGLIHVMEILKAEMGGQRQPEFMSTHPDPGNRAEAITQVIEDIKSGRLEGPKSVPQPLYRNEPTGN